LNRILLFIWALTIICGFWACTDDTPVGSGILSADDIGIGFTDEVPLSFTQSGPMPLCFNFSNLRSLGILEDENTGRLEASFYVRPLPNPTMINPNFSGASFDSLVLALTLDTTRTYGRGNSNFDFQVFELTESLPFQDTFCTNFSLPIMESQLIGESLRVVPSRIDSIVLPTRLDSMFINNAVTVRLNDLGERIFADSLNNLSAAGLEIITDGLFIRASSFNALVQVNFSDLNTSLVLFYTDSTGNDMTYQYLFSSAFPLTYDHDIAGSLLEETIANGPVEDQYFVNGHGGAMIEVDLSQILEEDFEVINHVGLEVTVTEDRVNDADLFDLPQTLDLFTSVDGMNFVPIEDLRLSVINRLPNLFDGELRNDSARDVMTYEMNITTHVKEMLNGSGQSSIFLQVRDGVQNPNSIIIYGPDHPVNPAKVNITYTKL
jgi:hypothetical protein